MALFSMSFPSLFFHRINLIADRDILQIKKYIAQHRSIETAWKYSFLLCYL